MQTKENEVTVVVQQILDQVRRAVVGKDEVLLWVLAAILARGHILLEDIPGVGKTTMALAFSKALDLSYSRIQFTPDVLPSDITGYSIPDAQTGGLRYQPGAVLTNLFLADELNRATSRTQSALLEAMEEGQVTVDGVSHPIPSPFIVIATQNPVGAAGTQLLPDSQMDRFMIRLSLGYPEPADEVTMVLNRQEGNPLQSLMPIVTREQLIALQDTVERTFISDTVVSYIVRLVGATRNDAEIARGASPRATLAVAAMSKAVAQLRGRDYVIPGDVREVFARCVEHRLILTPPVQTQGILPGDVLERIVQSVPAPKLRYYVTETTGIFHASCMCVGLLCSNRRMAGLDAAADCGRTPVAVAADKPSGYFQLSDGTHRCRGAGNGGGSRADAAGQLCVPDAALPGLSAGQRHLERKKLAL